MTPRSDLRRITTVCHFITFEYSQTEPMHQALTLVCISVERPEPRSIHLDAFLLVLICTNIMADRKSATWSSSIEEIELQNVSMAEWEVGSETYCLGRPRCTALEETTSVRCSIISGSTIRSVSSHSTFRATLMTTLLLWYVFNEVKLIYRGQDRCLVLNDSQSWLDRGHRIEAFRQPAFVEPQVQPHANFKFSWARPVGCAWIVSQTCSRSRRAACSTGSVNLSPWIRSAELAEASC
jgi:hypothetical protein